MLCYFLSAVFLFYIFFDLWLMGCAMCQAAAVKEGTPFVLFEPDTTEFKNDVPATKKFKFFTSPSLSSKGKMLVVVAQAKDKNNVKKGDIVEGHFKFDSANDLTTKFSKTSTKSTWTMQVVTKDNTQEHCKGNPTTVAKNTKLYVFFNSGEEFDSTLEYSIINDEIADSSGNGEIKWSTKLESLKDKIKLNTEGLTDKFFVASGGSGIVVNNFIIVPLWYKKNGGDFISAIINSSDTTDTEWTLVSNDLTKGEKYPAVVEWDKKVIMMTSCEKGFRKVYEYDEVKKKWTEAVGSLSGVWGNTERTQGEYGGKNGFITAEIKEKGKVMLLLQPVKIDDSKYKLHLWMTDNKRVSLA